jgi:hypothetical protein
MQKIQIITFFILMLSTVSCNNSQNESKSSEVKKTNHNSKNISSNEDEKEAQNVKEKNERIEYSSSEVNEDFFSFFSGFCSDIALQKSRNKTNKTISIDFEPVYQAQEIIFEPNEGYLPNSHKKREIYYYFLNKKREKIETYKFQFSKNKWFLVDFKNENIELEKSNQSVLSYLYFMQINKIFMRKHLNNKVSKIDIYPNEDFTPENNTEYYTTDKEMISKDKYDFLLSWELEKQFFSTEELSNSKDFRIYKEGEGGSREYFFKYKVDKWILVKELSQQGC